MQQGQDPLSLLHRGEREKIIKKNKKEGLTDGEDK